MLNIGGGELLIILLVALIFLGPTRLPEVARQLGQAVGSLRAMASGFQAELEAAARPDPPVITEKPKSVADPEAIGRAAREMSADQFASEPGSVSAGGPVDLRHPDPTLANPDDADATLADGTMAHPDDADATFADPTDAGPAAATHTLTGPVVADEEE